MKRHIFFLLLLLIGPIALSTLSAAPGNSMSETADSPQRVYPSDTIGGKVFVHKPWYRKFFDYFVDANKPKNKKFDFSIIGGPHYSSDTKFGIGLVAAGLYRIDRSDTLMPPSDLSLYGDITTSGFFLIGVRGNNLFPKDRYRLLYNFYFFSLPSYYWGIGYEDGDNPDNKSKYKRLQMQGKIDFLFRLAPHTYLGPNASIDYIQGKNLEKPELLYGEKDETLNTGAGITFMYDSRDFISNASEGLFIQAEQRFFPGFMGNKRAFTRTGLIVDYYQKVWKGGILAFDFFSQLNYGDTPWSMMAKLGGPYRMRGYFEGQYRDKNIVTLQVELRQRIWKRNGIAVWGGAGNVFHSFDTFQWKHTLPTYGFGYRWEFKKRMNVRLDFGIGRKQTSFLFNISEAF